MRSGSSPPRSSGRSAKAGTHSSAALPVEQWIPAFAGMTTEGRQENSTMSSALNEVEARPPITLPTLFVAFLKVSLWGIGGGGGLVWGPPTAAPHGRRVQEQE